MVQPSVTAVICLEFGLTQAFCMVIYRGSLWMEQTRVVEVLEGGGLVQLIAHRVWK